MYQNFNAPYLNQPYPPYQPSYAQNIGHNASGMAGRFVNDFTEVTANDVPMDGNYAVFIKTDGSEVQLRKWNSNGFIDMTSYKPQIQPEKAEPVKCTPESLQSEIRAYDARIEGIEERIEALANKVSKIGTPLAPSKPVKKAVNENE